VNYTRIDYHKKYYCVVVKNKDRHVKGKGTVNNTREEVQRFLELYCPEITVVEATRNWGLIYDWLDEVFDDVALAHPLKVKAIAEASIRTDKISADVLADLLRTDLLPIAYAPSKTTTEHPRDRSLLIRAHSI
jgi:transposase